MNAEAIVDSKNYRITLYVVDWIRIQTVYLCYLKPGVSVEIYMYLGGVMIKGRFIYLRKGKP